MGWETRAGRLFYYRKRRIGRRVVSEYGGSGEAAAVVAALDAHERAERDARRKERQRMREQERAIDAEIDAVCQAVRTLTAGVLLLHGYHTHKGQWRKTRDGR